MSVVNWNPIRIRLLMKNHTFDRLGGSDRPTLPASSPLDPLLAAVQYSRLGRTSDF